MKYFLKNIIKNSQFLYKVYTDIRYKNIAKTRNWVLRNQKFIRENQLNTFVFYENNAFCRVYNDIEFEYHPEILGGILGLEKKNGFESKEIEYVLSNIKEGDTVLDIGANFGFYSIILAKKNKHITLHSFEPVPDTFTIFKKNIEHNKLSQNIIANNCGVGNKISNMLITSERYAGNHLLLEKNSNIPAIEVPIITIDSYVEEKKIEKVDFIKCDVEGAEFMVLKGAALTLERDTPIIFIEISDGWTQRFGYTAKEVIEYLLSFGYSYHVFDVDGNSTPQSTSLGEDIKKGSNFFFYFLK